MLVAFSDSTTIGHSTGAFVRRVESDGAIGPRIQVSGTWTRSRIRAAWRWRPSRAAPGRSRSGPRSPPTGWPRSARDDSTGDGQADRARPWQLSSSERPIAPDDPNEDRPRRGDAAIRSRTSRRSANTWSPGTYDDAAVGGRESRRDGWTPAGAPVDAEPIAVSAQQPDVDEHRGSRSRQRWSATRDAALAGDAAARRGGRAATADYETRAGAAVAVRRPTDRASPRSGSTIPTRASGRPRSRTAPCGLLIGWKPMKWTRARAGRTAARVRPGPGRRALHERAERAMSQPRTRALDRLSSRPGATLECRFDGGVWEARPVGRCRELPDGVHRVRACARSGMSRVQSVRAQGAGASPLAVDRAPTAPTAPPRRLAPPRPALERAIRPGRRRRCSGLTLRGAVPESTARVRPLLESARSGAGGRPAVARPTPRRGGQRGPHPARLEFAVGRAGARHGVARAGGAARAEALLCGLSGDADGFE